jgi:Tat protein translocase TatB subunit
MFNVGGGEIIVVLLLALLVLGPDKLPSTAKKVGKFLHEFRRMTSGFEQEVRKAMDLESLGIDSKGVSTSTDAIHRATDGPKLTGPRATGDETAPPTNGPSANSPSKRAFVADLSDRSVAGDDSAI